MKTPILIILSLMFVMSCKSKQEAVSNSSVEQPSTVLISKGNLHGSGAEGITAQNMVITNQSDWNSLMKQMDSVNNVSKGFEEIDIDFSNYFIIAIFANVKSSGGHQIEVNVSGDETRQLVNVKHIAPKGMATSVMTQPYYIAKIPKTDLPIVFK
ncbi:protease complex subunit PrcB family protein [Winogradskyella vidalii]|uniref:protease complex subunit PrcB family protein n=1 Tax=Winogradskyella vidalii TaxID=2615024 RepID=UPI0015CE53E8|nr:protease complex subunit PrcB family protein [Winogradskyella vidalii]